MATFDLRFPDDMRRALADFAATVDGHGPETVLAATGIPADDDPDIAGFWLDDLRGRISGDTAAALELLRNPAFGAGETTLPDDLAFAALRGFGTLRLTVRDTALQSLDDDALETGRIDRRRLPPDRRHALACYGAFGEIQAALCGILDL